MSAAVPDLVLNGRVMTRPMAGVGRTASELADALITLLSETGERRMALALPGTPVASPEAWPPSMRSLDRRSTSQRTGHLWEQLDLPRHVGDDWLLNLCNTGPVMRSKQALMIHDAQAFTQTATYTRAFRSYYRLLLPILARRARLLLTVSEFSRRELEDLGVFPKGKAHVIHNGVDHFDRILPDPETLDRHGLKAGGYLLAIGSLAPHKNIRMLIEAAQSRQVPAVPLVIAGGKNSTVFRDEGLSDGDGVRFLGQVSDGELKALYRNACALVFPSLTEGFGLPPLEAMSCGCPVIATTGGAVPEVCGEAAIYADPARPEEWAAAMTEIAANKALRDKFTNLGRSRAKEFTWRRAAQKLLALIKDHDPADRGRA